jgi:hypothetical protein
MPRTPEHGAPETVHLTEQSLDDAIRTERRAGGPSMGQSVGRFRDALVAAILAMGVVAVALTTSAFPPATARDGSKGWPFGLWSAADWNRAYPREQWAYSTGVADGLRTAAVFARAGVDLEPVRGCVERSPGSSSARSSARISPRKAGNRRSPSFICERGTR